MSGSRWLPWERLDERSPIADRIAADCARAIVERRRDIGDFITEAELAEDAGASRTPAREAMLQLEKWSLVRLIPKKGAIVTAPTTAERRDMLDFRAMIENDAVRSMATNGAVPKMTRDGMEDALRRQRAAISGGDLLEFASADYAFHAEIIRGGGNSVVTGILEMLAPRVARFTYLAITETPGRIPALLDEHIRLSEAALAGDVDGYHELIFDHIARGHSAITAVP
ncbi:GntR family transcriptional regulator [Microbacterium arborescens]|uniref:GntR family transcriptional regulator n=1 Tax=Microbacterium arborescens TaxID=33883 RepID=UPI003C72A577